MYRNDEPNLMKTNIVFVSVQPFLCLCWAKIGQSVQIICIDYDRARIATVCIDLNIQEIHHNNNGCTNTSWCKSIISIRNVSKQSREGWKIKCTKQPLLVLNKVPACKIQGTNIFQFKLHNHGTVIFSSYPRIN